MSSWGSLPAPVINHSALIAAQRVSKDKWLVQAELVLALHKKILLEVLSVCRLGVMGGCLYTLLAGAPVQKWSVDNSVAPAPYWALAILPCMKTSIFSCQCAWYPPAQAVFLLLSARQCCHFLGTWCVINENVISRLFSKTRLRVWEIISVNALGAFLLFFKLRKLSSWLLGLGIHLEGNCCAYIFKESQTWPCSEDAELGFTCHWPGQLGAQGRTSWLFPKSWQHWQCQPSPCVL